jgi:hypothetical protein
MKGSSPVAVHVLWACLWLLVTLTSFMVSLIVNLLIDYDPSIFLSWTDGH